MTLDEAIKHCEEVAEENQRVVDTGIVFDNMTIDMLYCDDTEVIEEHLANYQRCANEHQQLVKWLKCLAKIADMLDGTIDHLSGDDAKELLSDVKWELKLAKLTEV